MSANTAVWSCCSGVVVPTAKWNSLQSPKRTNGMLPWLCHGFAYTGLANESNTFDTNVAFDMLELATNSSLVEARCCSGNGKVMRYAWRVLSVGASSSSCHGAGSDACGGHCVLVRRRWLAPDACAEPLAPLVITSTMPL